MPRNPSPATRAGYHAGRTPANAGQRLPPEILTADEVRALIRACSPRALTGARNRALLVVLYRGGLRISEALALRPKDVDAAAGSVTVLHGKGDKRRTIGVDPGAFAMLESWLAVRASHGLTGRQPIFCTLTGPRFPRRPSTPARPARASRRWSRTLGGDELPLGHRSE